MPLPALRQTADWYAIDFREVAAVPSEVLSLRSRIAACSQQGILLLQQRYAFHLTRLAVPLANLNQVSLPVFTESELMTDWVEAALDAAADGADATVAEARGRSTPTSTKTTAEGASGFSNRICTPTSAASAVAR